MTKMIVIGAGVMGASVAYRLAQAGADVTVLEATRIGGGTSGISFAWTNAHKKPPKPYHDLNVGGMKAHAALKDEFGATPWWHGGGSLEWELEPDRADQRANVEQLRGWGYAAEWIDLKQVQELEPDIDPAVIGDAPVAYFPEEGWLDPVVYAHAMLSAAQRRHGTKIVCGAKVVDLLMTGDRVSGVRLADGTQYEADMVVNCAGRWINEAVREAFRSLRLSGASQRCRTSQATSSRRSSIIRHRIPLRRRCRYRAIRSAAWVRAILVFATIGVATLSFIGRLSWSPILQPQAL